MLYVNVAEVRGSTAAAADNAEAVAARIEEVLTRQRKAFVADGAPSAAVRIDPLDRAIALLVDHQHELCDAMSADHGVRSAKQTLMAGFGKTSLLAAWSRELSLVGIRPAWLSVDAHDADLHYFFGYVAAALNAADPAIGSDVIELVGRRGRAVQPALVVHLLLDSIAAHAGRVVLVIDDYHAAAGSAIDQALSDLVVHAPPNFHVVVAGRGTPPLRLTRLRAADQVLELSREDLAFDQDEVRAFFVRSSGFALAPQEVAQLRAFSEGWLACLQFAAISMRRKQDLACVLRAPRSPAREIASYLRDDVLQGIESELRSFLARTSAFGSSSAPAAWPRHDGAGSPP
jgi:LuxR family maltose regulon positive regulatory protein